MNKKDYGLIILGGTTLLFIASTALFGLAYAGAENDSTYWQNKAQEKTQRIENLNQTVENLNSNISQLQSKISSQKFTINNLQKKVKQPMLFTSSPSWWQQEDGDVHLTFTVYNFGKTSAQNVEAKMYIYDNSDTDKPKAVVPVDIGNIAGQTTKLPTYEFSVDTEINSKDTALVKISKCKDCLKLWNRIPGLDDMLTSDSSSAQTTNT